MFPLMSMLRAWRLVGAAAVAMVAAAVALPVIADAASGPSGAQISAAVQRAEKSSDLWATINVCNVKVVRRSGFKQIGVRVQMPALGFSTRLYMTLGIQFWAGPQKGYVYTNVRYGPQSIGLAVHSPRQDGYSFYFKPPAGGTYLMRGVATLEWRVGRRVLARVTRATGGGHQHVDFGNPRGLSVATCKLTG
jgi:hypothetical protein